MVIQNIPSQEQLAEKTWWRCDELAVMFGVTRRTIYRWAAMHEWNVTGGLVESRCVSETFYMILDHD